MNLSPSWQDVLTRAGFSAEHWTSLGSADALDVEIMEHAKQENSVVLTHDLDFSAILAVTQQQKPSVIQLRAEDTSAGINGEMVIAAITKCAVELEQGALITVEPARFRLTLLPLARFG